MSTRFFVILTFLFFQTFGTNTITASSNVTCIQRERGSLLQFKQVLTDSFHLLSTWSGVECCEWHGVGCDSQNNHVVKLDLRSPGYFRFDYWLGGKLSHSLQNLKHLRYLDLSMNKFSGNIPEFLGSFENLEYLNLSGSEYEDNGISYIRFLEVLIIDDLGWVSSLSSLTYLDLSGMSIGNNTNWLHPVSMPPSLLTLNLVMLDINIPFIKFANFTSLSSLDLSLNDINSTVPVWLSNLTSLLHLNLQLNKFYGQIPDFFGRFNALVSMDLSLNSFESSIPDLLCNLSSLVHLDLSVNKFTGRIPENLGQLSRLEDLYLGDNHLSGNIPMSLGQLSKLKSLDLYGNSLVGVLSETHFTKLKNLIHLVLSWNSLASNFSSQWIPPFQLHIFKACSCNIGPHFPDWLQTQTNLERLDLSYSSIRDTIPEWFENILYHILYLDLSNNQISGKLPRVHFDSSNSTMDGILMMNSNKFEGSLATFPYNVKILDLSDNLLSGLVPQTYGTKNLNLEVVNLSNNRFTGIIPVHLCKFASIMVLDLSKNKFSGRLPGCLGNLIRLQVLDLSNNTITGVVPSSLGSLKYLGSLHLYNNRYKGYIPVSLQNLTKLVTMDLGNNMFTGAIPFWIGKKQSKLRFLNLRSNKFTGKIPLQLCQLNSLQYLSLAHNSITGMIPPCFGNLGGMINVKDDSVGSHGAYQENILAYMKGNELVYTSTMMFLTSLDLSSNNITGEIPVALMNLVGLKNLNLSRNQLKGHIPMTIGNLTQMESLDLSMNMLSGQIPQSLATLNFLSYLNLSFNNFSGAIPIGNQLQTLADPSIYEGNEGLCGPPVSSSCNGNNSTHNHVGEDGSQDDDEGLWYYGGMGSGFFAGFMGLVGSLYIIRAWRLAYFKILANVYGWLYVQIMLTLARLRRKFF